MSERQLDEKNKAPYLVFTCQHDSHPFQQRTICLSEQIKVGRSVARTKPSEDNALFDCKVLSRSHAIIWHENGRFWLRDTNSSNGTFINNTRVIKQGNDEYADRELVSGDIIRFGVEVVEHETTHGCIIARVAFYTSDGLEIQPSTGTDTEALAMVKLETLQAEKVFRLTHCVNEAMHREQSLETKLESLSELLKVTQSMSDGAWQAMLNEYKLLQKLELYETQLSVLKERLPPDSLQSKLSEALEEKVNLKKASELMLARVLTEKTEALNKATNLECCLSDSERECTRLRHECESTQAAYQSMSKEFQEKLSQLTNLENECQAIQNEKENLETQLRDRIDQANLLQVLVTKQKFMKANHDLDSEPSANVNGLDYAHQVCNEPIIGKVSATTQLQTVLNMRTEMALNDMALTELDELDRYCDMQAHVTNSETNLARILDTTSGGVSSYLMESVQQFQQSLQLIKRLQDELTNLDKLKMTLSTEFANSIPNSSTTTHPDYPDYPHEPDELVPISNDMDGGQKSGDNAFTAALSRAQHLTSRVAVCHTRAEASLSSFCAMQKNHPVCATSGDVSSNMHASQTEFVNDISKADDDDPTSNVSSQIELDTNAVSPATVDVVEFDKLKEELQAAVNDAESNKLLAENYKQEHAIKAELLLSVREECDSLRQRISQIEADVSANQEAHQCLLTEGLHARAQIEKLQQERDELNQKISNQAKEIVLFQTSSTNQTSSATSDTEPLVDVNPEPAFTVECTPELQSTQAACPSLEESTSNLPPANVVSTIPALIHPCSNSNLVLFAVVPAILLLCAIMVYIFSKFL